MGLKDRFAQPIQSIRRSIADNCDQMLKKKLAQYIFQKLPQNIVSEKVQFFKLAQTVTNNLGFFVEYVIKTFVVTLITMVTIVQNAMTTWIQRKYNFR